MNRLALLLRTLPVLLLIATAANTALAQSADASGEGDSAQLEIAEVRNYTSTVDDQLFLAIDVLQPADTDGRWPIVAYLCDGRSTSVWLAGAFDGSHASLASEGASMDVSVAGGRAYGTVTLEGTASRLFTAELATEEAGLYRAEATAEGVSYVGGWIVLDDGRQRGALLADGAVIENPAADLSTRRVDAGPAGSLDLCCCGVVFPCSLQCCALRGTEFPDVLAPAATPSPN